MDATQLNAPSEGITLSKQAQKELMDVGNVFRQRHPWIIQHQDQIGFGIFATSAIAIVLNALAYAYELVPAWATIIIAAFWMSLLHELEHDLIHYMYFRKNKRMHNIMMAGVWLFRPSTISPWVRRNLHLHHHKFSGTESDLEERGITNGVTWGWRRLLMTGDHMLSIFLRPLDSYRMVAAYIRAQGPLTRAEQRKIMLENATAYFPLGVIHYTLWHGFIIWHAVKFGASIFGFPLELNGTQLALESMVDFVAVVVLMPNVLRVFCLHFVSSNMHYFGDVVPGNVIQQTQVWNTWWLFPLHLFCFNFGATHAIHHFVVRDTFYVRQITASKMYPILKKYGVRFNDFSTFRRNNRWNIVEEILPLQQPVTA